MFSRTFYAWVTADNGNFADALCSKLVKRGFFVCPASTALYVSHEDYKSCIIGMSVQRQFDPDGLPTSCTAAQVYAEIADVLLVLRARYLSLVVIAVGDTVDALWCIGNARHSVDEKLRVEAAKKIN